MLPLVFLVSFAAIALASWGILRPRDETVARRIAPATPRLTRERRLEGNILSRTALPSLRAFGNRAASWLPQNFVRRIDHMLDMANNPWSLPGFLGTWALIFGAAVALWLWLVTARVDATVLQALVLGMAILPFAALGPYAVLRRRVKTRTKAIVLALPDALDLMVTSVEAGMGPDAAFLLVHQKTKGPLSEAIQDYLRQASLGRSRAEALVSVAEKTGVQDFITLAAAINQGEELGTSLGDVLRRQAEDLRALRAQRAREQAQKMPVWMTIPLVFCFLPAMGAVIVVPSILNLIDFATGLGD